ncbi:MAG: UDP-N-acetylmuramate:L-alanyl-gamma-D-glutamyl-meso-diaminopimelate ligase [Myxococcota bacterium]|nr:UDP-N-acetylmuramate:L-alanyl-gamma-D-glutamyl-meso-diaminopimelate ligase [Myxococcota bacterium]
MNAKLQHVHFIAIGGTGMGSLAGLLKARGLTVTGSDTGLYPPMSTALERWRIPVAEGFSAENLGDDVDLFVIGNAVRPDNAEAVAAIESGIPYRSFSDALYELAMADKHSVVVSGTHGKTTTTNLAAFLLHRADRDPSLLVGGISLDFDGSFRDGEGSHFVVEGDEYDTAFFDKTPKFLHYHPRTLIITSVEFDHADIYRDLDHVMSVFRQLVASMPENGTIVAACDHASVRDVVHGAPCRVISYGLSRDASWRAQALEPSEKGTSFELIVEGEVLGRVHLPFHGDFNVENAVAALAAATVLGVPLPRSLAALGEAQGVKRRQEIRGEEAGVVVVDDFAHHPTAVKGSIGALRARFPGRRLVAIFEPRTNTSRRAIFQEDYARAFEDADRALVYEVPDEPIYSATGEVSERFSSAELCRTLARRGLVADALDEVDAIVDCVVREAREGDVVLVMSNGGFEGIWEKLLAGLRASATA